MKYLKYISDRELIQAVGKVLDKIDRSDAIATEKMYKNVIDPFSAVFEGMGKEMPYSEWIKLERMRQAQKTMQNAIGAFHQDILGAIAGWENLKTGKIVDLMNKKKQIIAEIKNKHNTTKGDNRDTIYDNLRSYLVDNKYRNFTGYYVEIIPKKPIRYNKPFTPSDHKIGKRRPLAKNICVIDGYSFYELASDSPDALQNLFEVIPVVMKQHFGISNSKTEFNQYLNLFNRAFSTE